MEFYRHSGALTASGLILAIIAGAITATVLGVVYSYAVVYIPLIYVNFLLTGGFGFVLGHVVGKSAQIGKIRSNLAVAILGALFGLLGLYVAWAADPMARGFEIWALDPNVLLPYVKHFYENGFWGITDNGGTVSGIFLGFVWLVEAAVIVGAASVFSMRVSSGKSFCERCNQWTNSEEGVSRLSIANSPEEAIDRLLEGDFSSLADMLRVAREENSYLRIDLATCPTCSDSNFMSLTLIRHGTDKKGKPTVEKEVLMENLIIEEKQVPLLREAGRDPSPEESTGTETQASLQPGDFDFLKKPEDKPADFKAKDFDFS